MGAKESSRGEAIISVVAWDGKTLAADKQATCAGLRFKTTKIRRLSTGEVLAWTGGIEYGAMIAQWYELGADPEKWPKFQADKENWSRLIVATASGVRVYEQQPIAFVVEDEFQAWGAGRDFALGAMWMGASARQAVEITCRFSTDCGCGVDVVEL